MLNLGVYLRRLNITSTNFVIHDANLCLFTQHYSKNVKVDDDDGHYIVVPDAELTDKCMLNFSLTV